MIPNSNTSITNSIVLSRETEAHVNCRNVRRVSDGSTCVGLILARFTVIAVISERSIHREHCGSGHELLKANDEQVTSCVCDWFETLDSGMGIVRRLRSNASGSHRDVLQSQTDTDVWFDGVGWILAPM